jgi:hypothetical protein
MSASRIRAKAEVRLTNHRGEEIRLRVLIAAGKCCSVEMAQAVVVVNGLLCMLETGRD